MGKQNGHHYQTRYKRQHVEHSQDPSSRIPFPEAGEGRRMDTWIPSGERGSVRSAPSPGRTEGRRCSAPGPRHRCHRAASTAAGAAGRLPPLPSTTAAAATTTAAALGDPPDPLSPPHDRLSSSALGRKKVEASPPVIAPPGTSPYPPLSLPLLSRDPPPSPLAALPSVEKVAGESEEETLLLGWFDPSFFLIN